MLLLIDSYDSYAANYYYQYFSSLGKEVLVVHNTTVSEVERINPEYIVISPALDLPTELYDIILNLRPKVPILGICSGHQLIGLAYGGELKKCDEPVLGKVRPIYHDSRGLFTRMPNPFWAMRNHSHIISRESLPECLEISAWTQDGMIMGLRHYDYPTEGIQFSLGTIVIDVAKNIVEDFVRERKEMFN